MAGSTFKEIRQLYKYLVSYKQQVEASVESLTILPNFPDPGLREEVMALLDSKAQGLFNLFFSEIKKNPNLTAAYNDDTKVAFAFVVTYLIEGRINYLARSIELSDNGQSRCQNQRVSLYDINKVDCYKVDSTALNHELASNIRQARFRGKNKGRSEVTANTYFKKLIKVSSRMPTNTMIRSGLQLHDLASKEFEPSVLHLPMLLNIMMIKLSYQMLEQIGFSNETGIEERAFLAGLLLIKHSRNPVPFKWHSDFERMLAKHTWKDLFKKDIPQMPNARRHFNQIRLRLIRADVLKNEPFFNPEDLQPALIGGCTASLIAIFNYCWSYPSIALKVFRLLNLLEGSKEVEAEVA